MRLLEFQQQISAGLITDDNVVEVEGERDTVGGFKRNFDGFADALLMGDPMEQLTGVAEADWAVRAYFLKGDVGGIDIVFNHTQQR